MGRTSERGPTISVANQLTQNNGDAKGRAPHRAASAACRSQRRTARVNARVTPFERFWTAWCLLATGGYALTAHAEPARGDSAYDLFNRGYALSRAGDFEAAALHFRQAFELKPSPVVLFNLAQALAAAGQPVEAKSVLERLTGGELTGASAELIAKAQASLDVLQRRVGRLVIEAVPASAVVFVDGRQLSDTELQRGLDTKSGPRTILAQAAGHLPQVRIGEVIGGETAIVRIELQSEPHTAFIDVRCDAPGFQVLVNGQPLGQTPLGSPLSVSPGQHRVLLRRAGYQPQKHQLTVTAGGLAQLRCAARWDRSQRESSWGRLILVGIRHPERAQLSLDGAPPPAGSMRLASDGLELELPAGAHKLVLRHPLYLPWISRHRIEPGRALRTEPPLRQDPAHLRAEKAKARRALLVAGGGAALGVTAAALAWMAHRRIGPWKSERTALEAMGLETSEVVSRRAGHQQEALRIQRISDVSVGLGIGGVGLSAIAAGIYWDWFGLSDGRLNISAHGITVKGSL